MSRRAAFLLQGALAYALDVVGVVVAGRLGDPTPCAGWDVRTVLTHLTGSVTVLRGGCPAGAAAVDPPDPVAAFIDAACLLLAGSAGPGGAAVERATAVGAVEVAVHGWDVARACGISRPLPRLIASELLVLAPSLVPDPVRAGRFGAPVSVPPGAAPGDGLVAFLGRCPTWSEH